MSKWDGDTDYDRDEKPACVAQMRAGYATIRASELAELRRQLQAAEARLVELEQERKRLRFGLAWERGFTGPGRSVAIQYMRTHFGPLFPAWLQEEIQEGRRLVEGGKG